MVESEAYFIKEIDIPCETDNISFQAREIGAYSVLFERETNIHLKQCYLMFLEHAENELEKANGRLTEYRKKLISFNEQQREF